MATHKSAAVAARQRVHEHLKAQTEALTKSVEAGLKAVDSVESIQAEKVELLDILAAREKQAQDQLAAAVDELRALGKSKSEIAELLGIDPKSIRAKRSQSATRTTTTAPVMPNPPAGQ